MTVLLSTSQVARELGIAESTVRRWCQAGLLPAARVGPGRLYKIDAVDLDHVRGRACSDLGVLDRAMAQAKLTDVEQVLYEASGLTPEGLPKPGELLP
jgi:excisionase family DNA binding protein